MDRWMTRERTHLARPQGECDSSGRPGVRGPLSGPSTLLLLLRPRHLTYHRVAEPVLATADRGQQNPVSGMLGCVQKTLRITKLELVV